jgi:glycosyltransferase involved in cell wall biosynthesis
MPGSTYETRRLRVLHLVDSLRVGGKERQAVELIKGLCSANAVDMMIVTMGEEQFYVPDIQKLGVPLVYLLRRLRWDPAVFPRLWRILRDFRPDIIHTNSEMAMSYAWPLARLSGIKLINGTIRNAFSGSGLRWQWHKLMLRLADACLANSKAGFASRGLPVEGAGHYVIYNGFDMERFESRSANESEGLGFDLQGRKLVGMVAEFSDYKDFPTFIRAAQEVLAQRKDVVFIAIGDGKNLDACKRMVSPNEECIWFLGERKDVEAFVQQMDIGVLCTFTEGISNSVMEYMAAGKPVVVTDGGGSSELVADGETGFLVPSSNPTAVAEKVELLLGDAEKAQEMGVAGRRRLEKQFSLEQLVEHNLRMYQEVLNGGGPHVQHRRTPSVHLSC